MVFHTLAGLTVGQTAATRLPPADAHVTDDARHRILVYAGAFVLAVMSHGILDGLKHEYPFRGLGDTLSTTVLFITWMMLVAPRFRGLLALTFVGAVLPDLIDHVPRDLDRHLGWHLPVLPKIFPWHWPAGSGSLSGAVPLRARIASLANHVIVVTTCAALLWITRGAVRPGSSLCPRPR